MTSATTTAVQRIDQRLEAMRFWRAGGVEPGRGVLLGRPTTTWRPDFACRDDRYETLEAIYRVGAVARIMWRSVQLARGTTYGRGLPDEQLAAERELGRRMRRRRPLPGTRHARR